MSQNRGFFIGFWDFLTFCARGPPPPPCTKSWLRQTVLLKILVIQPPPCQKMPTTPLRATHQPGRRNRARAKQDLGRHTNYANATHQLGPGSTPARPRKSVNSPHKVIGNFKKSFLNPFSTARKNSFMFGCMSRKVWDIGLFVTIRYGGISTVRT